VSGLIIAGNRSTTNQSYAGPYRDWAIFSPNFTMFDNINIRGELYTNFYHSPAWWAPVATFQQEHPQSLTRGSTSSNVTLGYGDHYVGVTAAPVTITLPSAAGREGKELVIVDEGGNATSGNPITVSPSGGQTINGASSKTITVARSAITLISDGSNWFISRSI
jgi:hypothetical protein